MVGQTRIDLPLAAFGAPSCILYQDVAINLPIAASLGTGTLTASLPNQASLVGLGFYIQSFVPDLNANAFGMAAKL